MLRLAPDALLAPCAAFTELRNPVSPRVTLDVECGVDTAAPFTSRQPLYVNSEHAQAREIPGSLGPSQTGAAGRLPAGRQVEARTSEEGLEGHFPPTLALASDHVFRPVRHQWQ